MVIRACPEPIWHGRGIMLCDRAVTLAFDAVPDGGTIMRDGARALCA